MSAKTCGLPIWPAVHDFRYTVGKNGEMMDGGLIGPKVLAGLPWGTLILTFSMVALFAWFKKVVWPMLAGKLGETRVRSMNAELPSKEYEDVGEVTLALKDGSTTQIDHVIVSRFGIFVIETKFYDGWIFGSAKSKRWTQQIYKKKSQFQNPLRQNWRHIKALEEALKLPESAFVNVVVFVGGAEFKTDMPEGVFKGRAYLDYIRSFAKEILTPEQVSALLSKLRGLQQNAPKAREHLANLKARHAAPKPMPKNQPARREPDGERFCPRCGSKMVVRTNRKNGEKFLGCSAYPKCRSTAPYRGEQAHLRDGRPT